MRVKSSKIVFRGGLSNPMAGQQARDSGRGTVALWHCGALLLHVIHY